MAVVGRRDVSSGRDADRGRPGGGLPGSIEAEPVAPPGDVSATLATLGFSLDPLRRAGSMTELLDLAPRSAARMGFDRVLLSRVEDSLWIPERIYVSNDTRWAEEILEAGRSAFRRLDESLLETKLVRRPVPLRVTEPESRPLMHRELLAATRTPGYVAVPIDDGESVIGFLHADCYHQRRVPTAAEAASLWSFARSLGCLLSRQEFLDRKAARRRPRPTLDEGLEPVGRGERVSRREAEVLALLAAGADDERIARRLDISAGAVESAVDRVVRKLGATSRAEAVARWVRGEDGLVQRSLDDR